MTRSVLHMFFATLETSLFMIGGISAWYILNQRNSDFFAKSLKIVLAVAIAVAPLQIYIGHLSGEQVQTYQPTKLAAMEAQWETIPAGQSAAWSVLAIPNEEAEQNDWEITGRGYYLKIRRCKPTEGMQSLRLALNPLAERCFSKGSWSNLCFDTLVGNCADLATTPQSQC